MTPLLVERLAQRLADDAGMLAWLMACEVGKPIRFGQIEANRTAESLRATIRRFTESPSEESAGSARLRRRPHGTVAVITPWNNPIYIPLSKFVPAVLYGNKVIWKPAPQARMISRRLHQLLHEAGWSLDLVALVEGGAQEAEQIMEDRSVKAVTITGSAVAGTAAQKICGRRGIPLQAELGGNNAAIVWDDADLPEAVRQITAGAFEMAGQRCTANRRVIVADTCRDEFLRLLIDETARLSWGHPLDVQTRVGPLVDPGQRDRVAATVARAIDAGGPGFVPHGRAQPSAEGHDGAWYPPTILCRDEPHHEIVQEETFGPVLVVQTARCWAEAITLCNGVRQGLAAAVFTRSRAIAHRFLEQAEAGILKINQSTADAAVDVPFGGWKASGVGLPEHGVFDREFYTRPQTVYASAGEELGCATIIATSRIDKPFPHSSSSKPHSVPNTSLSTRDFGGRPTVS